MEEFSAVGRQYANEEHINSAHVTTSGLSSYVEKSKRGLNELQSSVQS